MPVISKRKIVPITEFINWDELETIDTEPIREEEIDWLQDD